MTLNEQLINLKNYNVGFNIYCDNVIVNVNYPEGWNTLPLDGSDVKMFFEEGKYYYCLPIEKDSGMIFDIIRKTIQYNLELEEKIKLFNDKVNELKQLFIDESYDSLKTLSFVIPRKRTRKKRAVRQPDTDNTNIKEEANTDAIQESVNSEED